MDIVLLLGLVALGLAAGTLGSLLGLGGGFLVVPALILLRGMKPEIATGTSVAVIVPAMLTALWRRGSYGHVDWKIAGLIAVGAVVGALVGSWLSTRVEGVWIRRLFAGVLVVLAGILAFKD
jgi:uncharacterized membrane protein YfcA